MHFQFDTVNLLTSSWPKHYGRFPFSRTLPWRFRTFLVSIICENSTQLWMRVGLEVILFPILSYPIIIQLWICAAHQIPSIKFNLDPDVESMYYHHTKVPGPTITQDCSVDNLLKGESRKDYKAFNITRMVY